MKEKEQKINEEIDDLIKEKENVEFTLQRRMETNENLKKNYDSEKGIMNNLERDLHEISKLNMNLKLEISRREEMLKTKRKELESAEKQKERLENSVSFYVFGLIFTTKYFIFRNPISKCLDLK